MCSGGVNCPEPYTIMYTNIWYHKYKHIWLRRSRSRTRRRRRRRREMKVAYRKEIIGVWSPRYLLGIRSYQLPQRDEDAKNPWTSGVNFQIVKRSGRSRESMIYWCSLSQLSWFCKKMLWLSCKWTARYIYSDGTVPASMLWYFLIHIYAGLDLVSAVNDVNRQKNDVDTCKAPGLDIR